MTDEEKLKLGEWLTQKGITAGQAVDALVFYQNRNVLSASPLVSVWSDAARNLLSVEESFMDGMRRKKEWESEREQAEKNQESEEQP